MKVLTVNMHPSAGVAKPLVYEDVKEWERNEKHVYIQLEDNVVIVCLNAEYVLGIVWKEEPEQPEMWDVEDE
jgi:hypothetical protein